MDKKEFERKFKKQSFDGKLVVFLHLKNDGILTALTYSINKDNNVFLSNGETMGYIPLKLIEEVY